MSKVLLINGSPNKAGCTYTALREVEKSLNKNGVETEIFQLGKGPVQGCTGCGGCGPFWTGCFLPPGRSNSGLRRAE